VKRIRAGQYDPLDLVAPDVPKSLGALVDRMLASNPEFRPQTGADIVSALGDITRSVGMASSAADVRALLADLIPDRPDEMRDAVHIVHVSNSPGPADVSGPSPAGIGRVTPSNIDASVPLSGSGKGDKSEPMYGPTMLEAQTVQDAQLRERSVRWP